jgi:hypothetical protein
VRVEVAPLAAGPAADAEAEELLAACPDAVAQQTPGWRDVVVSLGEDRAGYLAARAEGRLVGLLPVYHFAGTLGGVLVSCAQPGALGGVACRGDADRRTVYGALLDALRARARELGCALATVITNPFRPDRDLCDEAGADFVLENRCQVLDLAEADGGDDLPHASSSHRRSVRKALGAGLEIDDAQSTDNVAAWHALHVARQRASGAEPLPRALADAALAEMVPRERGRFFFVRHPDSGRMIAGGLYLAHGSVVDAYMTAFDEAYGELCPNHLLAVHSIRWARSRGARHYNWQASPPGGGVERFKRGWGSRDLPYAFLTWVTGDVEPFFAAGADVVRAAYRGHYALPFDRLEPGSAHRPSSRASAWHAAHPETLR